MTTAIVLALLALNLALLLVLVLRRRPDAEAPLRELERGLRDELARHAQTARADLANFQQMLLNQAGEAARTQGEQLRALAEGNEKRLGEVRTAVESKLAALQEGNERKLEQMRVTVDEKLHATLENRLGEMQTLARDVGSLNRVLTNVKSRGVFGEVQLAGLLEQVLTPEQYASNVETVPGSNARVEYAIRLPGKRDDGVPLWLPIDAKFPR